MFKRTQNKNLKIDTLIGADTRINGDVEFSGGLHLDGYINGNVKANTPGANLRVSDRGSIEGSVLVTNIVLNGLVKGDVAAAERGEWGEKARVMGNVRYSVIETAVGAQINGKLIHRTNPTAGEGDAGPTGSPPL
jgi:cytoskeletal protein CcmA (bactofilin family)